MIQCAKCGASADTVDLLRHKPECPEVKRAMAVLAGVRNRTTTKASIRRARRQHERAIRCGPAEQRTARELMVNRGYAQAHAAKGKPSYPAAPTREDAAKKLVAGEVDVQERADKLGLILP